MKPSSGRCAVAALVVLATLSCAHEPDAGIEKAPDDTFRDGSVEVGGVDLKYVVEGAGRPCIVVGSATYYPRTFSDDFKRNFRCVYVDTRMFTAGGSTGIDPTDYTMDVVVDDLERVRRALDLNEFVIFGHSMHALMALEYAKTYPGHVSGVVMIGMSPSFDAAGRSRAEEYWEDHAGDERRAILDTQLAELTDEVMQAASPEQQVVLRYAASGPMYWYDPHYDATWLWEGAGFDVALMNPFLAGLQEYDVREGLPELQVSVLAIVGEYDFVVPHILWDGVREEFPSLSYHLFDRSGHTPQLEEPARFDSTVIEWVDSR